MEEQRKRDQSEHEGRRPEGRILALDLGEKRIGIALSDELQLVARSYEVMPRRSRAEDFAHIAAIVAQEEVTALVVGLPVELDGAEGPLAKWVRDYSAALAEHVGLEVTFWDESFTSKQASASMRERGIRAREQKDWIDAVAAAFILQDYLNARRGW